MKLVKILYFIMVGISLVTSISLGVILTIILTNSIAKYLLLFYIIAIVVLLLLQLFSAIIEIHNKITNEHKKNFVAFKDNTWQSYIYFSIIIFPLMFMIIIAWLASAIKVTIDANCLLQVIYWVIAFSNFIWFYFHLKNANTLTKQNKINLMLKLAVCIVSAIGLIMDYIAKLNFTYQFIVMAWTVLFMSYLSDKKNLKSQD